LRRAVEFGSNLTRRHVKFFSHSVQKNGKSAISVVISMLAAIAAMGVSRLFQRLVRRDPRQCWFNSFGGLATLTAIRRA
jgi:hypothetical protein